MKLIVVNSIHGARKYFSALTPEHSFQSYSVQCAIEKSTMRGWYYSAIKRPWRFFWHVLNYRTYVVMDDLENPILIAPVLMNVALGSCSCAGTTPASAADYMDFLYASAPDSEIQQALKLVFAAISREGCSRLTFGQLASNSKTFEYLSALGLELEVEKESRSVLIDLGARTYDEYFMSLGKHAKQNVRTAYNRLSREGHTCRFEFYSRAGIGAGIDSPIGKDSLLQCEKLYFNRQDSRYQKYKGIFTKAKQRIIQSFCNYTTLAEDSPDLILATLSIDDEIAAFMRGYFKHDRSTIELPRLAINDKYGWYSPGLMLLNEASKFFLAETCVRGIDLCRGAEKYKLDMGGGLIFNENGHGTHKMTH